jgi:hypothetical protein
VVMNELGVDLAEAELIVAAVQRGTSRETSS